MTSPETFVSRWARLKQDPDRQRLTTEDASENSATAATAQLPSDQALSEPFDLASLPLVDSITADTDIRAFLQSRVPLQLTQAALRRTWTADPAIRDFIGIAEGQWDFNDPNAIPGFGPLQEVQRVPDSLVQTVQETSALAETIPQLPASVEEVKSAVESPSSITTQNVRASLDTPLASGKCDNAFAGNRDVGAMIVEQTDRTEGHHSLRKKRTHGSALPQ